MGLGIVFIRCLVEVLDLFSVGVLNISRFKILVSLFSPLEFSHRPNSNCNAIHIREKSWVFLVGG